MKHRSDKEKLEILERINDDVRENQVTVKNACANHGLAQSTYSNWTRELTPDLVRPQGTRVTKNQRHPVTVQKLVIPEAPVRGKVVAFYGSPDQVAEAIAEAMRRNT